MFDKYLHQDLILFGKPFDPSIKCSNQVRVDKGVISIVQRVVSANKLSSIFKSYSPQQDEQYNDSQQQQEQMLYGNQYTNQDQNQDEDQDGDQQENQLQNQNQRQYTRKKPVGFSQSKLKAFTQFSKIWKRQQEFSGINKNKNQKQKKQEMNYVFNEKTGKFFIERHGVPGQYENQQQIQNEDDGWETDQEQENYVYQTKQIKQQLNKQDEKSEQSSKNKKENQNQNQNVE